MRTLLKIKELKKLGFSYKLKMMFILNKLKKVELGAVVAGW